MVYIILVPNDELMFRYRYRIRLTVAVSCLFGYHRQPKASNVNGKCYNTFNLISRQLMPITFVYSGLFVAREILSMARQVAGKQMHTPIGLTDRVEVLEVSRRVW